MTVWVFALLWAYSVSGVAEDGNSLLDRFALSAKSHKQWALPGRLREISALAMTADNRLLTVADEKAVVYEIDYEEGGLVKAFALGDPTLRRDFEGLAVVDGNIYLLDSKGNLFVAKEGGDGERVEYERVDTDLDDECEFEGLTWDDRRQRLLLLCKEVLKKADMTSALAIFAWDIVEDRLDREGLITLPEKDISAALRTRRLHPSGIVVDRQSGHLLMVAAREHALIELDGRGKFISAIRMPLEKRHPQMEGIELAGDGRLILADEGGKAKARLSIYETQDMGRSDGYPE